MNHDRNSGDPALIHPFLAALGNQHDGGEIDIGAAALHLAVRCASGNDPIFSLLALGSLVLIRL
jgi:hypothetical protein